MDDATEARMTRIASLCSGYEGIGLGLAEALDIDLAESLAWHAELDDAPARVHEHHFPDVPNYRDIKSTCWPLCEPVDWLTAGYPCQPFSLAGKRKGTDDPRHLWPYIAEAVRILRPGRVLLENVPGHLSSGFGTVLGDLAEIRYDARWIRLPASGVGAPHRRERVFILATDTARHSWRIVDGDGKTPADTNRSRLEIGSGVRSDAREEFPAAQRGCSSTTDPAGQRRSERRTESAQLEGRLRTVGSGDPFTADPADWGDYAPAIERWQRVTGRRAPRHVEPNSKGNWRYAARFGEWMMGLPDGWITSPEIGLTDSQQKKIIGNGVVPQQCAEAVRHLMGTL